MRRRALMLLLPLSAALLPGAAALGQTTATPDSPPPAGGSPNRQAQPRLYQLDYDQMNPRQKQRLQQGLAGEGKPPMAADEARRTWNAMTEAQRRQLIRRAREAMQGEAGPGGRDTPR